MLKEIIKRDGSTEPFQPSKVNSWSIWASEQLGNRVDWASVVMEAMSHFKDKATSQELQKQLIKICVQKKSWPYNLMAGRLYAAMTRKEIYDNINPPTIYEVHKNLQTLGLMKKLDYTEQEYEDIEKFIDHSRDFEYAFSQVQQLRKKYAIRNRVNKQEYESPQFVFMRMAMALAETEPKEDRLKHIVNWYNHFSFNRINAPSPNYINLGTRLNGYASCCVYKSDDQVDSLAIGDHIAYKMTAMSAGIGGMISTRTLGDPVRSGAISHAGKLPYYRALAFATRANQQAGRGGACTTYYSAYDPENITIAALQNPTTTVDKRIRELHFAVLFNRLFTKKAAKNEEVFVFTEYSAPDLWQAMFSGDQDAFEKLYQEYEDNEYFKKNYVNAREFVIYARQQAFECGTHYEMWIDEANRHTPFKDPIHSSNLCVAGNTKIRTDEGEVDIKSKVNQMVNVWNGEEWSKVTVRKTGENKKLYRVWTWDNKYLDCTAEHRWYIQGRDDYVETKDLPTGSKTIEWKDPDTGEIKSSIITVKQPLEGLHDTYCFTEPKRHMGVFNDILTGQCVEIMLPTAGYTSIMDLYSGDDHGKGEIAICALAGLVVCNIHTEEQYESAAYYALKMIDKCIDMSDYPFEHVKLTARSRRSAGVGILGLATSLARMKLKYSSQEGKDYCHEVAERHYYYLLKASLKLGKELGNAPWIHKTKWPEGWLPIDTYKKTVDTITAPKYNYDWEAIRKEVIANGGIRNSVLVAHMPTESSSKAAGAPNCIYPIRELSLKKSDNSNIVDWVAMDSDLLENDYELSWDIPTMDMIKVYAIFQKFTDQGISADLWQDRTTDPNVYTDQIIEEHIAMCRYGIKSRYYQNSLTSDQGKDSSNMTLKTDLSKLGINLSKQSTAEVEAETDSNSDSIFEAMSESDRGCAGGACSL